MFVKEVTVENQVGLHARPATFFIQKANEYKSSIWVEKEERRVNAKSLLGVLSLGIVGGTNIRIIADGADEESAVDGPPVFRKLYAMLMPTKPQPTNTIFLFSFINKKGGAFRPFSFPGAPCNGGGGGI